MYHQALLFASLFLVFYIFNLFFVFTFSSVRSSLTSQGRVAPCGLPRACLFFNSIFQTCWRDGCDDCVGAFVLTDFFFLFLLLPLLWFIRCVRNSRGAATRIFLTHSHLQRGHQPLLLLVLLSRGNPPKKRDIFTIYRLQDHKTDCQERLPTRPYGCLLQTRGIRLPRIA